MYATKETLKTKKNSRCNETSDNYSMDFMNRKNKKTRRDDYYSEDYEYDFSDDDYKKDDDYFGD